MQPGEIRHESKAGIVLEKYQKKSPMQVRILTDAVDDITTVDDFLAVSENHILEDVNKCVAALQVRASHTSVLVLLSNDGTF